MQMPTVNFLWVGGTPELVDFWRSQLTNAKIMNVNLMAGLNRSPQTNTFI